MKEREEAWVKIENLAKANPQVLKQSDVEVEGALECGVGRAVASRAQGDQLPGTKAETVAAQSAPARAPSAAQVLF